MNRSISATGQIPKKIFLLDYGQSICNTMDFFTEVTSTEIIFS